MEIAECLPAFPTWVVVKYEKHMNYYDSLQVAADPNFVHASLWLRVPILFDRAHLP
jgi:hypothetical protein